MLRDGHLECTAGGAWMIAASAKCKVVQKPDANLPDTPVDLTDTALIPDTARPPRSHAKHSQILQAHSEVHLNAPAVK